VDALNNTFDLCDSRHSQSTTGAFSQISPISKVDYSSQVQQAKASTRIVAKEWLSACLAVGKREDESGFYLANGKSATKACNQAGITSSQSDSKPVENAIAAAVGGSGDSARAPPKNAAGPAMASSPPLSKRQRQTNCELGRSEVRHLICAPRGLINDCRREQ
jgi:hypothetical protein